MGDRAQGAHRSWQGADLSQAIISWVSVSTVQARYMGRGRMVDTWLCHCYRDTALEI